MIDITINDLATILGLIIGVSAFVLSILNYLRDKAKVHISLQWDMESLNDNNLYGIVTISNTGRRPIYISHLSLKLPKSYENSYLLIRDGLSGQKLMEGDAPLIFDITHDGMDKYKSDWETIIAQVTDSSGKVWKSKKVKNKPSWAK